MFVDHWEIFCQLPQFRAYFISLFDVLGDAVVVDVSVGEHRLLQVRRESGETAAGASAKERREKASAGTEKKRER